MKQLKITETELEPVVTERQTADSCPIYKVQSGDSLWNIAQSKLGDGNLYAQIINQNKETYPSLGTSNSLEAGWELKVCPTRTQEPEAETEVETIGYRVNVEVTDKNQEPVEGAKVTIHSNPQEGTTDDNGLVRFENVEAGQHTILVAYNGYDGEQTVNLTGDVREFNLNITIEQKPFSLSPLAIAITGITGVAIFASILLAVKLERKSG